MLVCGTAATSSVVQRKLVMYSSYYVSPLQITGGILLVNARILSFKMIYLCMYVCMYAVECIFFAYIPLHFYFFRYIYG